MKKLQLLTITMLLALAGISTVEARLSSMMRRLQQTNATANDSESETADTVKLPNMPSMSKLMKKAAKTQQEGTVDESGDETADTPQSSMKKRAKNIVSKHKANTEKMLEKARQMAKTQQGNEVDVKLPKAPSVKKMIKQARNSVDQGSVTSDQINKIKKTVKKKAKMIVEMLQNSSKQNEVILEMVQGLVD